MANLSRMVEAGSSAGNRVPGAHSNNNLEVVMNRIQTIAKLAGIALLAIMLRVPDVGPAGAG